MTDSKARKYVRRMDVLDDYLQRGKITVSMEAAGRRYASLCERAWPELKASGMPCFREPPAFTRMRMTEEAVDAATTLLHAQRKLSHQQQQVVYRVCVLNQAISAVVGARAREIIGGHEMLYGALHQLAVEFGIQSA